MPLQVTVCPTARGWEHRLPPRIGRGFFSLTRDWLGEGTAGAVYSAGGEAWGAPALAGLPALNYRRDLDGGWQVL